MHRKCAGKSRAKLYGIFLCSLYFVGCIFYSAINIYYCWSQKQFFFVLFLFQSQPGRLSCLLDPAPGVSRNYGLDCPLSRPGGFGSETLASPGLLPVISWDPSQFLSHACAPQREHPQVSSSPLPHKGCSPPDPPLTEPTAACFARLQVCDPSYTPPPLFPSAQASIWTNKQINTSRTSLLAVLSLSH